MSAFVHPVTGAAVKLGRTLARRNGASRRRAARLHDFLVSLPDAPAAFDNTSGIADWGMMGNDTLGDCTIACPGHLIQAWSAAGGKEFTVPDSFILDAYEKWDGYVLGNPSTDQGGDILTVLQDWQRDELCACEILAHAEVNITQMRIQQAIYLFGGIDAGVNLPISAQQQVGSLWDLTGDGQSGDEAPGSWGGHCVAVVAYDAAGVTVVTWGALQKVSWKFFMWYFDEAHAIISPQWKAPAAVSTQLVSDLQQIGS